MKEIKSGLMRVGLALAVAGSILTVSDSKQSFAIEQGGSGCNIQVTEVIRSSAEKQADQVQAEKLASSTDTFIRESVKANLIDKYGLKVNSVDMGTLARVRSYLKVNGGYDFDVNADMGYKNGGLSLATTFSYDELEQIQSLKISAYSPLNGEVVPEVKKVADQAEKFPFEEYASAIFNLPSDVIWGEDLVTGEVTYKKGKFAISGRNAIIMVSNQGSAYLRIGQ